MSVVDDTIQHEPQAETASPSSGMEVAEDTYEPCSCVEPARYGGPIAECWWCKGTGYRLTKRILRSTPKPDFSEQTALALERTLRAQVARDFENVANDFARLGHPKEAARARQAAKAILQPVEGEG